MDESIHVEHFGTHHQDDENIVSINDYYYHREDDNIVGCEDGIWRMMDDCDYVEDGGYYPSDEVVEIDGVNYHKGCEEICLIYGDYYLKDDEDTVEIKGNWYLKNNDAIYYDDINDVWRRVKTKLLKGATKKSKVKK